MRTLLRLSCNVAFFHRRGGPLKGRGGRAEWWATPQGGQGAGRPTVGQSSVLVVRQVTLHLDVSGLLPVSGSTKIAS